ncbi:MAG: glycosyltransferase, partial [Candidatus Omnitrophica bacterium]|nr:glycosyltransferase [Candidatus Omnitrophota bacterium]
MKSRSLSLSSNGLKISFVIPNFNGAHLIDKCLDSIYTTKYIQDKENEVIVIDDGSTDNSVELIKNKFPEVKIIQNKKNMKFGFTCNQGVKNAKNELIVLINNDIIVTENFLEPIIEHFKDENVFAVTPKLYAWDRETFVWGMHMGRFEKGYVRFWNEAETKNGEKIYEPSPCLFAIGGAMIFRKSDFLWLGGFDEIYRPNSWEDIDIGYRAWKRGLKIIYEPRSLLYHKGKATVSYERHKEIKNELTFTWKNITDIDILFDHFRYFYLHLYKEKINLFLGLLWACKYFSKTIWHRLLERPYMKRTDKEILNFCMNYYRNFERNNFKHRAQNEKKNILLITPFLPYPLNIGGKIRIYTLAKFLKDRYNFYLLSLIHKEEERDYILNLKDIFKDVFIIYHKRPLSKTSIFPSQYKFSYSLDLIEKLKELQRNLVLDLVHIESNELLYLTKYIKHLPIIYTEHDISILTLGKSYYCKDGFNIFDYLKRVYFHCRSYRNLDRVVTLSLEDKQILESWFPYANLEYIPTGVDLDYFSFKDNDRTLETPKRLIFVGHYLHFPNEDAVIYFAKKIYPLVKEEIKDIEFLIVGSDPTPAIRELEKDSSIKVTGTVPDVRPYLNLSDVFVNPIRYSGGIKGKVLEAMAVGLPVVSTKIGKYGINAIDNYDILIADNNKSFASLVIRLIKDKELYRKISSNARRLVEDKYDWRKIVNKLDLAYAKTIYNFNKDENLFLHILDTTEKVVKEANIYFNKDDERSNFPEELHLELTYLCNSSCIMCDLWDFYKRNKLYSLKDELKLEEIKNFVDSSNYLQNIKTVVLSGGEPFLRKDFVEICGFFAKKYSKGSIGILSNCIDTKLTLNKTKQILDKYQPHSLWIGTSLDGIGHFHDKIRAKNGAFSGLKNTIEIFRKELPLVKLCATFTLTPYNIDQIISAYEFANRYDLDFFVQFVVPKESREKFIFKQGDLFKIEKYIRRIIKDLINNYDYQTLLDDIASLKDPALISRIYYYYGLTKYQKESKRLFKDCIAGKRFAMIDPFGNLYFCSLLKEKIIGNIKNSKFDELWNSEEADKIRLFINQSLCHCWLVCIIIPLIEEALRAKQKRTFSHKEYIIKSKEEIPIPTYQKLQEENINLNDEEYNQGKIVLESFPEGIGIGAHYNCNANCIFCFKEDSHINFNLEIYKNFFEEKLNDALYRAKFINFCGFGELLLMPRIEEFLDYINFKIPYINKIFTTNGSPLRESLYKRFLQTNYNIQISLLASHKELHRKISRLDNFDFILRNIERLVSIRTDRTKPAVSLVFIMNTLNIEDLPEFINLAVKLGVDEVICNYMVV